MSTEQRPVELREVPAEVDQAAQDAHRDLGKHGARLEHTFRRDMEQVRHSVTLCRMYHTL